MHSAMTELCPKGVTVKLSSLLNDAELRARIHEAELDAVERLGRQTPIQPGILEGMIADHPNKVIAYHCE